MAFQDNIPAAPDPRLENDPNYSSYQGTPQDPNEHPVSNMPDGHSYAAEAMESKDIQNTGDLAKRLGSKYKTSRKSGKSRRKK